MRPRALVPLLLPLCAARAAAGETYHVDPVPGTGDFTSVAEALASSLVTDGDTVRVHPGVYSGPLVLSKQILLESVDGPDVTVLDGAGLGTVLTIEAPATVQGFEISGGGGAVPYGGVFVTSLERATLRGCRIADNHPAGDSGGIPCGGVAVEKFASLLLVGNVIESNTSLSVGGLLTGPFATVDVIGNWIRGNGGSGTPTGGILFGASGRLIGNQITGNYGSAIGGLYVAGGLGPAVVEIVSCTIYGNRGTFPGGSVGGVALGDAGHVTIADTIVYENHGSPIMDLGTISDFWSHGGTLDLSFSHVKLPASDIPPGTGMVPGFLDPAFVAPFVAPPSGPTTLGDYHLTPPSPDVDAGDTGAFPLDASAGDLGGVLRVLGTAIDVGAYELGTSCEAPLYYGLGKVGSSGERPYLITVGEPSVSGAAFHLELHGASPLAPCMMVYGLEPGYELYYGGTLWITPTVQALRSRTTSASGSATFSVKLHAALIGTTRYYQCWFRDGSHPDGTGVGLSNAVAVTFCP